MEKYVKLNDVFRALHAADTAPIKQTAEEAITTAVTMVSTLPYIKLGEDKDKIHTIVSIPIMKTRWGCGFTYQEEQVGVEKVCE